MSQALTFFYERVETKPTLLCFSFSGAGANYFWKWARALKEFNMVGIQLPGRENRFGEPTSTDFVALVEELAELINEKIPGEFSIFGHSLGTMLGYAVCQTLHQRYGRMTNVLFVSGRCPPDYFAISRDQIDTDERLIEFLGSTGGAHPESLKSEEFLRVFLPIIRADLTLDINGGNFQFKALENPIITFRGDQDQLTPSIEMANWSRHTKQSCESHTFRGGHFFIDECIQQVHDIIKESILEHEQY